MSYAFLGNKLSICFLCENQTVRFGKSDIPVFSENSDMQSFGYILTLILSDPFQLSPKALFHLYLTRSTMSDYEEERWVKARHDVT
jgi:hypothetical protein